MLGSGVAETGKAAARAISRSGPTSCRPMLSEKRREALENMYTLVGTHSAVKLCRWQKSMLRGRGGCYKWTMYGIRSHQCMEATPSLACANNCVFCWRHNTNPTASDWRWQVDDPQTIVEGMLAAQRSLIHEVRGIPGVTPQGIEEAMNPRHCALSLVGEPILYPYVNAFVGLLHEKGISTFLVNNGQFPDAIARLDPVTQLYLSVDAPNKQTMKILDRPILPDYWERFNHSVDIMRTKKARTVFRLTMIDGFNMGQENLAEYKELFDRGQPDFVEIKRLTPAFSGNHNTILRIHNVPSWSALRGFAQRLSEVILDGQSYVVASVHEHSGCILLAHRRFIINDVLHSWIDFDKFNALVTDPVAAAAMVPEDYLLPTPEWAHADSPMEGFDPAQQRHVTNRKKRHLAKLQSARGVDTEQETEKEGLAAQIQETPTARVEEGMT